ncbi:hypothetical protein KCP70_05015 [Salmonella enterica subsp. enterica]|nr:hypothetical protein KCP70_05015 [Salmonella enterica subsp. enterica]
MRWLHQEETEISLNRPANAPHQRARDALRLSAHPENANNPKADNRVNDHRNAVAVVDGGQNDDRCLPPRQIRVGERPIDAARRQ